MTPDVFFPILRDKFRQAISKESVITRSINVGEFIIQMNFAGPTLLSTFYNAYQHLHYSGDATPDIRLYFWDTDSTGVSLNPIPWNVDEAQHLGVIPSFTNDRFYTLQQHGSAAVYMLDTVERENYYWVRSPKNIPWWESDFPLRMIFHWWLKDTPYQPVHAAAVGTENGGVLLVGKGGSGKSTSALFCINSPLRLAGDDYVLLNCKDRIAYSLFSLTKVNLRSLTMLTNLGISPKQLKPPIEDKYRIMLYPDYKDSLIKKIPIVAVLLPQVTQNTNTRMEACGSGEVLRALAPTTLFQLPGLREQSFNKMTDFVRQVPGFRLMLGEDSPSLPEIIKTFVVSMNEKSNHEQRV